MLWLMLPAPGIDVSPRARAARMSWRASSVLVQPRSSRCRRSQAASSDDIEPYGNARQFRRDTLCPALSRIASKRCVAAVRAPFLWVDGTLGRLEHDQRHIDPIGKRTGDCRGLSRVV